MTQPAYYTHLSSNAALQNPVHADVHGALLDAAFGTGSPTPQRTIVATCLDHFATVLNAKSDILSGAMRTQSDAVATASAAVLSQVKPAAVQLRTSPKAVLAVMDEALPYATLAGAKGFASVWVQGAEPVPDETLPWLPFGADVKGIPLGAMVLGDRKPDARQVYRKMAPIPPGARHSRTMERRFSHGASIFGQLVQSADAPAHPMVGVSFPTEVVRDTSGALLPYFAICGLLHVMAVSRLLSQDAGYDLPVVVNMSYGVLAGAKTGAGKFEQALASIGDPESSVPDLGPVHIVLPMGNGRLSRTHARVDAGIGTEELNFRALPDDRTPSFIEVRRQGIEPLIIEVKAPFSNEWIELQRTSQDTETKVPLGDDGQAICRQEDDGEYILLCFKPTAFESFEKGKPCRSGTWTVRVTKGGYETALYIQRDDSLDGIGSGGRQARFVHPGYTLFEKSGRVAALDDDTSGPVRRVGTVSAFATAANVWRVGGRFDLGGNTVPYGGLGRAEGSDSPDTGDVEMISDRSPNVFGVLSRSLTGGSIVRTSGTSIASARFAARLADFLAGLTGTENNAKLRDRSYIRANVSDPDTLTDLRPW